MDTAIYFIVCVSIYFLPAIAANVRKHNDHSAITLLNLFLGWTVIGWIAALVWSFTGNVKQKPIA